MKRLISFFNIMRTRKNKTNTFYKKRRRRGHGEKTHAKKTHAKKTCAKKTRAKKTCAKKTRAKKTRAKKTHAKKTHAKKTHAKKTRARGIGPSCCRDPDDCKPIKTENNQSHAELMRIINTHNETVSNLLAKNREITRKQKATRGRQKAMTKK